MNVQNLADLAVVLRQEREDVLSRWRAQVKRLPSAKNLDTPTLNDHVPKLLDELAAAFESLSDESIANAFLSGSPPEHGIQRYHDGFDIVEVVSEYNILRECINDLAERSGCTLRGNAFHIVNRVFDESIGIAVQTYATQQALEIQRRREEYLAFVAHDLRTPLNAISLAAQLLEQSHPQPEGSPMLKVLHRNVHQLQGMVDNVLKESDHMRAGTGVKLERREFDLWPLVECMINDLAPTAAIATTQLVNEVPQDLSAFADASLLTRVFQNLVANSIKYAPRGEIVIGARAAGAGGAVECWVRDNGAGIPADRIDRVFDKLETDPDNEDGMGLGLSIVKTFVEAHGGQVTVESEEGVGSTFRFTIPGRPTPPSR